MNGLKKPLLDIDSDQDDQFEESLQPVPITRHASSGSLGRITFRWLNSLLEAGAKKPLTKEDVPLLSPEHRATQVHKAFISNWPKQQESNSVRKTLVKTFWKQLIRCSGLAVIGLSVLFAGPLLIQSFVRVTSDEESFPYEGYFLVLVMFLAKCVEISSAHLYQFNTQMVGIQVRSALISTLYRKGLRLSSSSRQSHGVGQIVNYMSVDVQQLSDAVVQLNNIWLVPSQIIVALVILFSVAGLSAMAGLLVIITCAVVTHFLAGQLKKFQKLIMHARDGRLLATVEALSNMKVIKLQGWNTKFLKQVEGARQSEYNSLCGYMFVLAVNTFTLWLTPLASSVLIFACCVLTGNGVTATMAFTTIAVAKAVQEPLRVFPQTMISISQAMISLERLDRFLWSEEMASYAVEKFPSRSDNGRADLAILVEGGAFRWGRKVAAPNLIDINLRVKRGSLVAVVGKVGEGKSSLLAAVLGEMTKLAGKVKTDGRIAFVAQQAWIQSGTIQENILFGLPMNEAKYQSTLNNCVLRADLAEMEFGDQTESGERGLNLSGGQKQRIQLARAVYRDCDVYLLDDVFSAVDAHTGSDLFRDCILGPLASKTVLLVTHQIEFLSAADLILVVRGGRIVQSGSYEDLLTRGADFEALLEASNEAMEKVIPHFECKMPQDMKFPTLDLPQVPSSPKSAPSSDFRKPDEQHCILRSSLSAPPEPVPGSPPHSLFETKFSQQKRLSCDVKMIHAESPGRLTQDEYRESGGVSISVYWAYFTRICGGALFFLLLVIQSAWQAFQVGGDYWVATCASPQNRAEVQTIRFVVIYAVLAMSCAILVLASTIVVAIMGLKTAQSFYLGMLRSIFRAPMSFFDTTPTGRILSRVSLGYICCNLLELQESPYASVLRYPTTYQQTAQPKTTKESRCALIVVALQQASTDQASVDVQIPFLLGSVLAIGFQFLGALGVTVGITWQIFLFLVPLGFAFHRYQRYYFATSRELTRVDAITKAPLIHHFSETIAGFVTIRCFQQQDRFIQINTNQIDSNLRMDFHNQGATEWLGLRLEFIGILALCASTLVLVALPKGYINTDFVGLCLTYGQSIKGTLFVACWMYCQLENKMIAVERIGQYTRLPHEEVAKIDKISLSSDWPHLGTIVLDNFKVRYRPQIPLVLKGINMTITGGHKVGVVGRTGSGKSTLVLGLFRLVEACEGSVFIDGVDISTVGLRDLRLRLSIIPQEPVLFDGTVRSNLDPLEEYSDPEIWAALEKTTLAHSIKAQEGKLDAPVLEHGENWSVGQRQLFCLGRVLLKQRRILVLDEATASMDAHTDGVMQAVIRKAFANSTVISIAHRIPTVMNSDTVMVLDRGMLREQGSPAGLLDNRMSLFSSLVHEYSARSLSLASMDQLA